MLNSGCVLNNIHMIVVLEYIVLFIGLQAAKGVVNSGSVDMLSLLTKTDITPTKGSSISEQSKAVSSQSQTIPDVIESQCTFSTGT